MSVQKLISHFEECRRRFSELRDDPDYLPLRCAILRAEDGRANLFDASPFAHVLRNRPYWECGSAPADGGPFILAFYLKSGSETPARIEQAVDLADGVGNEVLRWLEQLPPGVQERLRLFRGCKWWRIVFHLAWHFGHPSFRASRERLLTKDGKTFEGADETFIQLYGTGGRDDRFPGRIFSFLEHDIRKSSESAIDVILDALRSYPDTPSPLPPTFPGQDKLWRISRDVSRGVRVSEEDLQALPALMAEAAEFEAGRSKSFVNSLTDEQRSDFRRLRTEFDHAMDCSDGKMDCKVIKLVHSFTSPPATEWAQFTIGGCGYERLELLSRHDESQEWLQIRSPYTKHFCELAELACRALPADVPNHPILWSLDSCELYPRPVMERGPVERWVGFVFWVLKQRSPESIKVAWFKNNGWLDNGLAILDRNLFAASVLAIDLAEIAIPSTVTNSAPSQPVVQQEQGPDASRAAAFTHEAAERKQSAMSVVYPLRVSLPPPPHGSILLDRLRIALQGVPHSRVAFNAATRTLLCLDRVLQRMIDVLPKSATFTQVAGRLRQVPDDRPRQITLATPLTVFSAAQECLNTMTHLRDASIAAAWFPREFSIAEFIDILDETDGWQDRANRLRHDRPFRRQLSDQFDEKYGEWMSGFDKPWNWSWQVVSVFFAWELTHMLRTAQSAGAACLSGVQIRSLSPGQTYTLGEIERATMTEVILGAAERVVAILNGAGFDKPDNAVSVDDMVAGWRAVLDNLLPYLVIIDEDGSLRRVDRFSSLINQEQQTTKIESPDYASATPNGPMPTTPNETLVREASSLATKTEEEAADNLKSEEQQKKQNKKNGPHGLVIIENPREARRGNKRVEFGSRDVVWKLFIALCKRHPAYYETVNLGHDALNPDSMGEDPGDNTVHQHIVVLRRLLTILAINPNHRRGQGYRLEQNPSIDQSPSKRKKRGKSRG